MVLNSAKKRVCKLSGLLLCALIALSMIASLPIVGAASVTGRSRVYGISATGEHGYKNNAADREEGLATRDLCNYIGNASIVAGYSTTNLFGSGTINTAVVSNAGTDEQNYLGTMLFHAGHFYTQNTAYQDNNGNPISASNIYPQTSLGRHFFIFLWVCVQAEDQTCGTTVGWTHRDGSTGRPYMTEVYDKELGYIGDDGRGQCYISFYGFSPMLSTYVNQSGGYYYNFAGVGSTGPCSTFAKQFYNYTLYQGYSVYDVLDRASEEFFGCDYEQTVLNTGYHSWWPGGNWGENHPLSHPGYYPRDFNEELSQPPWNQTPRDPNRMRVFGDSSIKLKQPYITLAARDNYNNPISTTLIIDGQETSLGNCYMLNRVHEVSAADKQGYVFRYFTYNGQTYYGSLGNPADIPITVDGTITAYYDVLVYHDLTVSAGNGGTTNPVPGTYTYTCPSDHAVRAVPNSGKVLDYWLLDNQNSGNRYLINVGMYTADRTLHAVFTDRPSYSFSIDLNDYSGTFSPPLVENPYDLTGYQPDGYYATINSYEPYQTYGYIEAVLNEQTTGHIFLYAHSGYESSALSVSVSNNGQSWTSLGVTEFTSTPGWVYCGASLTSFSYVKLEGAGSTCDTVYIDSIRVEPPTYHTLTISSTTGGYTIPSEDPQYLYGTTANVQAYTDSGYQFDYWLLDESYAGSSAYIEVPMYSDHTLEAVFSEIPPPQEYYLTILGRREEELMPFSVWIDDEGIGYMDTGTYVYSGEHKIEVEQEYAYYVFSYFDVDGAYVDYYNPTWIDVQSDMTITANYDYAYWLLEMMVLVNEKGMTVQQAFDVVQVKFDLTASHFEALKDVNWASQYQILQNNHKLDVVTVDSGLK